jgi:hypothetical protein
MGTAAHVVLWGLAALFAWLGVDMVRSSSTTLKASSTVFFVVSAVMVILALMG